MDETQGDAEGRPGGTHTGEPGFWWFVDCPGQPIRRVWIPEGQAPPPGSTVVLPTPAELARIAYARMQLPIPSVHHMPDEFEGQPETVVNFPTWLWVDPADFAPMSMTVSVASVWATVVAAPRSVRWEMGDGSVECPGPGVPYDGSMDGLVQADAVRVTRARSDCWFMYSRSSARQPGLAFRASAASTWQVTWTGSGGTSGALPPIVMTAPFRLRVAEIQTVIVSGSGSR